MKDVGQRIRAQRKKKGLSLEAMAKEVGVSLITLQRIETGKTSPSVALLSEIAQYLDKSILSFITDNRKTLNVVRKKDQQRISSTGLKVRLVGPRNMIQENISVSYGVLEKDESIGSHTNAGIEFAYILEGKCELKMGEESVILEAGDSVAYNARVEHEVIGIEKHRFLAIFVRDRE